MYHDQAREKISSKLLKWTLAALLVLALAFGCVKVIDRVDQDLTAKGAETLKAGLVDASVTCYAVEGSYPETLEYIEENYGVAIDEEKYLVVYDAFASNMLPGISVLLTEE